MALFECHPPCIGNKEEFSANLQNGSKEGRFG
jgi:hypothetical protein